MKINLRTIINSAEPVHKLGELKLKARLAYELSKSIESIDKEVKDFTEIRNKKLKEFGTEVKTLKGQFTFENDSQERFQKEIDDLLNKEVDIQVEKFSIDDLSEVAVEPNILRPLNWLIRG